MNGGLGAITSKIEEVHPKSVVKGRRSGLQLID